MSTKPTKPTKRKDHEVCVRMPEDLWHRVRAAAAAEERSASATVRRALSEYLNRRAG